MPRHPGQTPPGNAPDSRRHPPHVAGRHHPGCRCRGAAGCAGSAARVAATNPAARCRAVARPSPLHRGPGSSAGASERSVPGSVRRCVAAAPGCRSGCGRATVHHESGRCSCRRNPGKTVRRHRGRSGPGLRPSGAPGCRRRASNSCHSCSRGPGKCAVPTRPPRRRPPQTRRRSRPTRGNTSR
ncbi:hypothetical protein D3C85_1126750 [compost metagenome]